jgi:hypothetical protein
MAPPYSQHFDSIHIIESLRQTDLRTGSELVTNVLQPIVASKKLNIRVELHAPTTKDQFVHTLWKIAAESRDRGSSPILHIEVHGGESGIQVSSCECISWTELKTALTEINTVSRLNLLVVMAACKGAHLVRILWPTDRAPVWALIGPTEDITEENVHTDFTSFYNEFLTKFDGRAALEALNQQKVGGGAWRYLYYPTRYFFRSVYHEYLLELTSETALSQRKDRIVAEILESRPALSHHEASIRASIQGALRDHQTHFEQMKNHFFMFDLYPDNRDRFPLTLEECQRDPSEDPE